MKTCVNCMYFDPYPPGFQGDYGRCRINPPTSGSTGWPQVQEMDWCGRLREKPSFNRGGGEDEESFFGHAPTRTAQ